MGHMLSPHLILAPGNQSFLTVSAANARTYLNYYNGSHACRACSLLSVHKWVYCMKTGKAGDGL